MFWTGLIVAFIGGLLSIGLSREAAKSRYPAIRDYHLDVASLVLLLGGLVLSAVDHVSSERQLAELQQRTERRRVSSQQRAVMSPLLVKLRGRPVAFACRMMDGESCDYVLQLAAVFLEAGSRVPEPIKTSLNDLPGYLAITPHGNVDTDVPLLLLDVFRAAGIPAKVEDIKESSVGAWYPNVAHVIVGRKAP